MKRAVIFGGWTLIGAVPLLLAWRWFNCSPLSSILQDVAFIFGSATILWLALSRLPARSGIKGALVWLVLYHLFPAYHHATTSIHPGLDATRAWHVGQYTALTAGVGLGFYFYVVAVGAILGSHAERATRGGRATMSCHRIKHSISPTKEVLVGGVGELGLTVALLNGVAIAMLWLLSPKAGYLVGGTVVAAVALLAYWTQRSNLELVQETMSSVAPIAARLTEIRMGASPMWEIRFGDGGERAWRTAPKYGCFDSARDLPVKAYPTRSNALVLEGEEAIVLAAITGRSGPP